jgi:hypothetical protein
MSKSRSILAEENFALRRQVRGLRASLTIARLERDAARTALTNYNIRQRADEIMKKYGIGAEIKENRDE